MSCENSCNSHRFLSAEIMFYSLAIMAFTNYIQFDPGRNGLAYEV